MTTRQKNAIILILAVLATLGALIFLEKSRSPSEAKGPRTLDAVPADTFLVATADVARLRSSPLVEPLKQLGGGMEKGIASQCGFDPLDRLDALVLAIPEADGIGDFGIATAGPVEKDELLRCARTIMQARGGQVVARDVPNFTLLEDKGTFAAGAAKLAIHDRGPFILAPDPWLTDMMEAWLGKRARIESNARHIELRRALGDEDAGKPEGIKPAVTVTALLPAALRDRLKREMAQTPDDASSTAMLGVLGVESVGLALSLTADGLIDLHAELRCDTAEACARVQELIEKKRAAWLSDFRMRLIGLGGVLQALTITTKEKQLSVRARAPQDDARRLIERLLESRSAHASGDRAPEPTASGAPPDAQSAAPAGLKPDAGATARRAPDKDAGSR